FDAGAKSLLPWALGAASLLGAATLWPRGLFDRARRLRTARRRRRHPQSPWLWDRVWDPSGESLTPARRALRASTFPAAWLAPQLLYLPRNAGLLFAWIPVGLVLTWWAWRVHRVFGGGSSHVVFTQFPYAPG